MKNRSALVFLLFVSFATLAGAQSVSELEARLKKASSKNDRMNISYQLAEKLLQSNPNKAADYAQQATQMAIELGDKRKEAEASYLSADGKYRAKAYKDASTRFLQAWNAARNYGLRDVALNATEKLQDIALKQNDTREALKWSRETINYLKENSGGVRGGGDAQRKLENRIGVLESENRSLREQLAQATGQTQLLENKYGETEQQLKDVQEKNQLQLTEKETQISKISLEKQHLDSLARAKDAMVDNLTKEQLADSILNVEQRQLSERNLAAARLAQEQSESMRNLVALLAGFVFVLAILFYLRYLAKRRTANELAAINAQVIDEQKRSNQLLLNILPPAIAEELKARNKVAARKYDNATVMFIDFLGFTNVAERLTPEQLVEELDFCFSNFDRIISQYRIEKIKTIGDAYMCASGLSDMNASPSDMVKAALEIQDFLLHVKAERMSLGLPFFEARIGIHTGPVVAGVVGAKKFAYDIWGDTVNTAARMEEACEAGRVNVSEIAYGLAKYEFEWQSRGKIAAKNKGYLEMYYVTAMKQY